MLTGLYRIGSKMMLEKQAQELHSQNLAGAGLCGFKGRHQAVSSFRRALEGAAGGDTAPGRPVDVARIVEDLSQGALRRTDRSLDFALTGEGFFEVETPDGNTLLTRNGNFRLDPDGTLVTQEGYGVRGEGGALQFQTTDDVQNLVTTEDGILRVHNATEGTLREVGRLRIVTAADPSRLDRLSANYFRPGNGQTLEAAENARVSNGYQEQANVSAVREMVAMIQSLRDFESGHKMIQTLNDLARSADQKMG